MGRPILSSILKPPLLTEKLLNRMFGTRSKMENLLNYKKAALPAGRPEWAASKRSHLHHTTRRGKVNV